MADENANKTAQREDFRKWAIDHAEVVGIFWQPQDLRADSNKRVAQYTTEEILKADAVDLIWSDLWNLTTECGLGVTFGILSADLVTPMYQTAKGYDLSKMGVIDGKYEKNGNWAWAEIEMTLTLTKEEQEIYYTTKVQLVSGQLKKPHITKTSFTEDIKESLKEIGLWQEETKEAKVEKSTKAEPMVEETKEEEKPKYEVAYVVKAGLPRGQERAETMVVEAQNAEEACRECKRIMKEVHGINAFRPEAKRI